MHPSSFIATGRRALALAAAAVPLALAIAPTAHADSISFLRGGNVWVTSTDGAKQVQVTTSGGYSYASRADDGTFIALKGRRLQRISPTGQITADFDTPVSGEQTAPNTSFFRGPYKPEISPDGTKVAYEYWHQALDNTPGCFPVGDPRCQAKRISVGIGYSYADRQTGWDEPGLGRQSGWMHPSWIGNDTLLMSDKSVRPNVDAILDHPGDGNQTIDRWFEDTGVWYVRDGEVSRRADAAAFVSTLARGASDPHWGQEDDQITIYRMNGPAPALPEQCFSFGNPDAIYASPTFSPDGGSVAWESDERGGEAKPPQLLVGQIPSQTGGCQLPTESGKTLIEDAAQPDWSPAPVPTVLPEGGGNAGTGGNVAAGAGNGGSTTIPVSGGAGSGAGAGGAAGALTVTAAATTVSRALSAGLTVRLQVPGAGRLRLTASRGAHRVATGSAKAKAAGEIKVRLRFTAAARRALKRSGSVTLTVRYRYTPAGGTAVAGTTKVKLRN